MLLRGIWHEGAGALRLHSRAPAAAVSLSRHDAGSCETILADDDDLGDLSGD